jgi:hypothetical protein
MVAVCVLLCASTWQRDTKQMLLDLDGPGGRITRSIRGLDTLFAGFMTLGNPQSTGVPVLLMTAIGVVINALRVFGPIIVSVNPLPAVSLAGLFVLGLAAAAFGARRLRRR